MVTLLAFFYLASGTLKNEQSVFSGRMDRALWPVTVNFLACQVVHSE